MTPRERDALRRIAETLRENAEEMIAKPGAARAQAPAAAWWDHTRSILSTTADLLDKMAQSAEDERQRLVSRELEDSFAGASSLCEQLGVVAGEVQRDSPPLAALLRSAATALEEMTREAKCAIAVEREARRILRAVARIEFRQLEAHAELRVDPREGCTCGLCQAIRFEGLR